MKPYFVYVSENVRPGQTEPKPGLSVYTLDRESGCLRFLEKFPCGTSSNVSCVDRVRGILHVTTECADEAARRENGARVLSFRINEDGSLTPLGEVPTYSPNPAYLTLDDSGSFAVVANHTTHNAVVRFRRGDDGSIRRELQYDDATVTLYSVNADGTFGELLDVVCHEGSGPKKTQTHAHPHSAVLSPDGKWIAVCDKGADRIAFYRIDAGHGRLTQVSETVCPPGSEPRFCAFHPTKPWFYCNHEGDLDVEAFSYDENGALHRMQTVCAVEDGPRRKDVVYEHQGFAMHPSGRFLYSVTRGENGIAVFAVDGESGLLTRQQLMPNGGQWPRCCALSPDGRWLLAGCREGDNRINVYAVGEGGCLREQQTVFNDCGVAYLTFW